MKKLIVKFFNGEITLWKSYWIVGELINALIILLIVNIEINFFNNIKIYNQLPFLSFHNFHFFNKIILMIWTIFITVGIWRSAEKYKGSFIWIILTLIFLSYRIFNLRLILF